MTRWVSKGKCYLCGGAFSKAGMSRHLTTCRQDHALARLEGQGRLRTTPLFHLVVEGADRPMYWLHLEVPMDAKLKNLDTFLRNIWLECCGHLSAFTIEGTRYELDTGGVDGMWAMFFGPSTPPQSMNVALGEVLRPGLSFWHEYDFGTTTELTGRVVSEYEGKARGKSIQILARNDPPPFQCEKCDQLAVWVCSQCIYEGGGWLCKKHAPRHKCGEEMLLPVVNSPRVGMCGYTGEAY